MTAPLNFKQELIGCYGDPVAENPTQAMIEPALRALGLDWRYLTLEVKAQDLPTAVQAAKAFGFVGFNCTIPHKLAMIEHLDGLGQSASLIGAVNCVVRRGDQWIGENTDGKGFVSAISPHLAPAGKHLYLLGAGGAARAIAVEMALAGVSHITVANRDRAKGQALVELLNHTVKDSCSHDFLAVFQPWESTLSIPPVDLLVNATSIGLYPDSSSPNVDLLSLGAQTWVADVIPNPPLTPFLQAAQAQGCPTLDGLAMLVAQGVTSIEYWTGQSPDPAIMRGALETVFA